MSAKFVKIFSLLLLMALLSGSLVACAIEETSHSVINVDDADQTAEMNDFGNNAAVNSGIEAELKVIDLTSEKYINYDGEQLKSEVWKTDDIDEEIFIIAYGTVDIVKENGEPKYYYFYPVLGYSPGDSVGFYEAKNMIGYSRSMRFDESINKDDLPERTDLIKLEGVWKSVKSETDNSFVLHVVRFEICGKAKI